MEWNEEQRKGEQPNGGRFTSNTLIAAETLRNAEPPVMVVSGQAKGEERISVFWRVFGGTLLSITALICVTVYQQFTNTFNDLRSDLNRLNEARGDLIKKDEFNSRMTTVWTGIKEVQTATTNAAAAKERIALLEQQLKVTEDERKELIRDLQNLRERVALVEGKQAATSRPASSGEN
jgi:hypothetical protein